MFHDVVVFLKIGNSLNKGKGPYEQYISFGIRQATAIALSHESAKTHLNDFLFRNWSDQGKRR